MKYVTLALLAPLVVFAQANATTEEQESAGVWRSESPDGSYCCVIRRMPSNQRIWDSSFDNSRLMIFPFKERKQDARLGELYFAFDVEGRLPAEVKWTTDSQFLVFTTESSGGHSPWHSTTYVFSVSAKKIVCLDDVIGEPVVDSDFKLEGPHTGTFKIDKQLPAGEHPEPLKLDISRLFSEDPKGKIEQAGADQPATQPADKPQRLGVNLDQPTYWQGPNGERFVARYGSLSDDSLSFVKVTMPDGRQWTLPRAVSASGERYTDERVVWWLHQGKVRVDVRRDDGEWEEARWTLRPDPQVE